MKFIIPRADESSHAFPIKIEVNNKDGRLKAGMFARVALPVSRSDQMVMVPRDAVIRNGDNEYVFQVDGNKVQRVLVRTGRAEDGFVVVKDGLSGNVTVVVTGNEGLRDGAEVQVVNDNRP